VKPRTPGFTLLELLVAITIIGILMALLFPTVSAVYEGADRIKCQTNLAELAKCVAAYCQQNDGFFPFVGSAPSANDWLYLNDSPTTDNLRKGVLVRNKIIGADPTTWLAPICFCPEDADRGLYRSQGGAIKVGGSPITSYVINGSITYANTAFANVGRRVRRYTDFDGNDFLFIEESENSAFDQAYMVPNSGTYALTSRHDGGGYVACMDGSVQWMKPDSTDATEKTFRTEMDKVGSADNWYTLSGNRWNPG